MGVQQPPKLTEEARRFVVTALACFDAPSVVAKAVKEQFGLTVSPQAIEAYDPTKRAGQRLADKWRALFTESRARFLEDTASIGISHRAVRLRTLQRLVDRAETVGHTVLAAQLLEQAAKEVGDAYTNRVKLGGDPNAPPIATSLKVEFV